MNVISEIALVIASRRTDPDANQSSRSPRSSMICSAPTRPRAIRDPANRRDHLLRCSESVMNDSVSARASMPNGM